MSDKVSSSSGDSDVVLALFRFRDALVQRPELGVSHSAIHKTPRPRKPKPGCSVSSSPFRPHVLARDRIRFWSAPHSDSFHQSLLDELSPDSASKLLDVLLASVESKTRENYGSGLLRFHQFCDSLSISEDKRMPASESLLAAFIAHWAGKVAVTTADNWLAGLHFWHQFNNAPWHGDSILRRSKAGLSKLVPTSSKRPRRPPVTIEHMHALFQNLDLSNSFDSAVYCTASVAFWCCCRYLFSHSSPFIFLHNTRLGELVVPSISMFDPSRHISRSAHVRRSKTSNGISFSVFHIPWSKTTHNDGADIVATKIDDSTDPFTALTHHLSTNSAVPSHAPFFAFETPDGWSPMTRTWFITRCNNVWASAGLPTLSGHCFRIGGATELLLRGTPPDIVAAQGRWKSRAFLDYWRRIESILPLFITNSFNSSRVSLVNSSMDSYRRNYG